MQRRENVAAVVNGLLVMLLPLAVMASGSTIDLDSFDGSVTADVPGAPRMWATIRMLIPISVLLLPFALLTGWRTWVYAKRWYDQQDRGWRAVAEAGASGSTLKSRLARGAGAPRAGRAGNRYRAS